MAKPVPRLPPAEIERVIATAWSDRPPFDAVLIAHGLTQGQLVQLLKRELTPTAYKLWDAAHRRWQTERAAAARWPVTCPRLPEATRSVKTNCS